MSVRVGRVEEQTSGLRWRVIHPDVEHEAASSYLRELAASDCSPATVRSYAYALLRWFRFLDDQLVSWQRAERVDVRAFVEHLREVPNPQRLRRRSDAPAPGSINPRTGKAVPGRHYAARTINHQLSVLFGFYDHACAADLGPLVNPVPAQRGRDSGRVFAHHNPMESFVLHRRATYRQKEPRPSWRAIPDDAADQLFSVLRCHRDRALVSFWLTSGARAAELLGLRHGDLDVGAHTISVVSKGSRLRETIPASVDSFVWLALYLAEGPPLREGGPVWWTRRLQQHGGAAGHDRCYDAAAVHELLGLQPRPGTLGSLGAPCPVPRLQTWAASTAKRRQRATMQARTRALTPLLPAFVAAAAARRDWSRRLLAAAQASEKGQPFVVDGVRFVHCVDTSRYHYLKRSLTWAEVLDSEPAATPVPLEAGRVNITRLEEDSFWAWAATETLRHTGLRIEEMLELTQLSLRHYTPPSSNTLVPLLHIVPSKTDAERLVPMSPELVTALLEVQRRVKDGAGQVPLSVRYDSHERLHSQPLPHLFARRLGTRQEVLSANYVRSVLNKTAHWADLRDAGEPVRFTPHDFRRLFTTDLVGSGLPLHIVASLLGHLSLDTTRGYTAVFPEQVIAAHEAFIERRRHLRPDDEMRPANGEEWAEFEQHFLLRKVALGECHRPYGTPCVHEHACTRCRFLRVDPAQIGRIDEMTANAEARLTEARDQVWLGEVAALEESLTHLHRRRAEAEAQRARPATPGTPSAPR